MAQRRNLLGRMNTGSDDRMAVVSALFVLLAILLALLVAFLVLWAAPALLTRGDDGALTEAERLKAANDVRAPLVALLVAFLAGGTLLYTARTYRLNVQGHVTDRYTKAVAQLGDKDNMAVRIGGVYALERIGMDSPRDRRAILRVLAAFIRKASREFPEGAPSGDVAAALAVAGTLLALEPAEQLDLRGANLAGCDPSGLRAGQYVSDA